MENVIDEGGEIHHRHNAFQKSIETEETINPNIVDIHSANPFALPAASGVINSWLLNADSGDEPPLLKHGM